MYAYTNTKFKNMIPDAYWMMSFLHCYLLFTLFLERLLRLFLQLHTAPTEAMTCTPNCWVSGIKSSRTFCLKIYRKQKHMTGTLSGQHHSIIFKSTKLLFLFTSSIRYTFVPLKYTEVGEALLPWVESQPLTTPQSKAMLLIMCGNSSRMALLAFRRSGTSQPAVYKSN